MAMNRVNQYSMHIQAYTIAMKTAVIDFVNFTGARQFAHVSPVCHEDKTSSCIDGDMSLPTRVHARSNKDLGFYLRKRHKVLHLSTEKKTSRKPSKLA